MNHKDDNFDPSVQPTQPFPSDQPKPSEFPTRQQTSPPSDNPPSQKTPRFIDNNDWQDGDIKTDLDGKSYQIEGRLGSGGFAVTYLATELGSNQKVVLKVLKDELRTRPDFRIISNSFINEALLLKACQSPFIVMVDKVTEIDHRQVIIMEYIQGQNLGDKVRETTCQLTVNLALKYIKQVGEALKQVHSQNLLHRDIKPENIIIRSKNDEAVLIDFGLAFKFEPNNLEYNRQWLTPGYAPIEQYQEKVRWGFYTDIYSLAATLYYILTKETPIYPEDRLAGISLKPPQSLNSEIPKSVNFAIIEGLKISPDARPQTVEAWLELFNKFSSLSSLKIQLRFLFLFSFGILGLVGLLVLRKPVCESVVLPALEHLKLCQTTVDGWQNYHSYNSPEYEFRLKYPSFWQLEKISHNIFRPLEFRLYIGEQKDPVMIILIEELQSLYSLDEYWQNVAKPRVKNSQLQNINMQKDAKHTKLKVNSNKREHPALTFEYSYNVGNEKIKVKEIVTVYNYRGYTILFRGNEKQFQQYQEQADKIIQSFEFVIPAEL